jgi:hypothetical protein
VAVVYCKLVLLELEGVVADSAIIPLKFQQKVIICGGQSEPIKTVYIRFARSAKKIVFPPVDSKVFSEKLPTADSAEQHIKTPVDHTGA